MKKKNFIKKNNKMHKTCNIIIIFVIIILVIAFIFKRTFTIVDYQQAPQQAHNYFPQQEQLEGQRVQQSFQNQPKIQSYQPPALSLRDQYYNQFYRYPTQYANNTLQFQAQSPQKLTQQGQQNQQNQAINNDDGDDDNPFMISDNDSDSDNEQSVGLMSANAAGAQDSIPSLNIPQNGLSDVSAAQPDSQSNSAPDSDPAATGVQAFNNNAVVAGIKEGLGDMGLVGGALMLVTQVSEIAGKIKGRIAGKAGAAEEDGGGAAASKEAAAQVDQQVKQKEDEEVKQEEDEEVKQEEENEEENLEEEGEGAAEEDLEEGVEE